MVFLCRARVAARQRAPPLAGGVGTSPLPLGDILQNGPAKVAGGHPAAPRRVRHTQKHGRKHRAAATPMRPRRLTKRRSHKQTTGAAPSVAVRPPRLAPATSTLPAATVEVWLAPQPWPHVVATAASDAGGRRQVGGYAVAPNHGRAGRVAPAAEAAVVSGNGDRRHARRGGEAVGYAWQRAQWCPAVGVRFTPGVFKRTHFEMRCAIMKLKIGSSNCVLDLKIATGGCVTTVSRGTCYFSVLAPGPTIFKLPPKESSTG